MAYSHRLEQMEAMKDFEGRKAGAEKKFSKVMDDLAVAERKAQSATRLEAEVVRLQLQVR
jgi:hypothetical protein